MTGADEREMARDLHHLGVAAGQEDAIAHELVERFGWRKIELIPVPLPQVGQAALDPGAIIVELGRIDLRQRAEYLAAGRAERRMGNAR